MSHVYVGCRTTRERNARGDGINLFRVDAGTGEWTHQQLVGDLLNPSFLCFDRHHRFLYTVHGDGTEVSAFRIDAGTGRLVASRQGSVVARETSGPRHVVRHPLAGFAYVVNELDSTVTAYRYSGEAGALEPVQVVSALPDAFTGNSRAAEIAISADGRFVYASDRGSDTIAVLVVDEGTGRLTPVQWSPSEGRTPRFSTLDPAGRFLFVANEDDDTIQRFRIDTSTGQLTADGLAARTGSPVCIVFHAAA